MDIEQQISENLGEIHKLLQSNNFVKCKKISDKIRYISDSNDFPDGIILGNVLELLFMEVCNKSHRVNKEEINKFKIIFATSVMEIGKFFPPKDGESRIKRCTEMLKFLIPLQKFENDFFLIKSENWNEICNKLSKKRIEDCYLNTLIVPTCISKNVKEYSDETVIKKIFESQNNYLADILDEALIRIINYFDRMGKRKQIGVYVPNDPELKGEEINILINTNFNSFDEKMQIWTDIEKELTEMFEQYKNMATTQKDKEQIEDINKIIKTSIYKLEE